MTTSLQVPLQITVRDMRRSPTLEKAIRQKVAKLAALHPRISGCRVTIEALGKHQTKGRHRRVRIDVRVPGLPDFVADREHDELLYVALRNAFEAMDRQLGGIDRESRRRAQARAAG